ncbi:hypothetical protein BKA65DRAFT_485822 [Rhexocercosporidium sp. MPI-PUGE-AT-0058]|nr:hypothetical protein BKA65DRAFT_485822 [Rhexocercosporidium sp. MPI-PUGE-AT-0058]
MSPNLPIGTKPSFSLAVRHIALRLGSLFFKVLSGGISVLLNILWIIGFSLSGLIRLSSLAGNFGLFAGPERIWSSLNGRRENADPTRTYGESGDRGQNAGGVNGLPEGWVRVVICRTEDISELDLERCEGCRQVLETEIGVLSGLENSLEDLMERQERVEGWLRQIEKIEGDSGYSSPEADGELRREILWASPK